MHSLRYFASVCALLLLGHFTSLNAATKKLDPNIEKSVTKALDWLAKKQRRNQGYWEANNSQYRVAMTALAGNALLCEGSTTTRGKYSRNIRLAVDYLLSVSRKNGLIGYEGDYHYMYGHGFSMLFLSQVYGEEEDERRREELKYVLTNAVIFCGNAQTSRGGWGYVSAKDGNGFDEGSTCITQVQGLRACRNAGIPVPKQIIERAQKYIHDCTIKSGAQKGGVQYSIRGGSARPAITAAALASLFNTGEYDSEFVKMLSQFCDQNIWPAKNRSVYSSHWPYMHYYYAQAMYRRGGLGKNPEEKKKNDALWLKYFGDISKQILRQQSHDGSWSQGSYIGPVYTTAMYATILQISNGYLPIYQR